LICLEIRLEAYELDVYILGFHEKFEFLINTKVQVTFDITGKYHGIKSGVIWVHNVDIATEFKEEVKRSNRNPRVVFLM